MTFLIIVLILILLLYLFRVPLRIMFAQWVMKKIAKRMGMDEPPTGNPFSQRQSSASNNRTTTHPKEKMDLEEIAKKSLEKDKGEYVDFEETKD